MLTTNLSGSLGPGQNLEHDTSLEFRFEYSRFCHLWNPLSGLYAVDSETVQFLGSTTRIRGSSGGVGVCEVEFDVAVVDIDENVPIRELSNVTFLYRAFEEVFEGEEKRRFAAAVFAIDEKIFARLGEVDFERTIESTKVLNLDGFDSHAFCKNSFGVNLH